MHTTEAETDHIL